MIDSININNNLLGISANSVSLAGTSNTANSLIASANSQKYTLKFTDTNSYYNLSFSPNKLYDNSTNLPALQFNVKNTLTDCKITEPIGILNPIGSSIMYNSFDSNKNIVLYNNLLKLDINIIINYNLNYSTTTGTFIHMGSLEPIFYLNSSVLNYENFFNQYINSIQHYTIVDTTTSVTKNYVIYSPLLMKVLSVSKDKDDEGFYYNGCPQKASAGTSPVGLYFFDLNISTRNKSGTDNTYRHIPQYIYNKMLIDFDFENALSNSHEFGVEYTIHLNTHILTNDVLK